MFHKMPFILIAIILAVFCIDGFLPIQVKQMMYALSLTIKGLIVFVLPVLIFMLLFKTMAKLAGNATKLILFIIVGVVCSNFISVMTSLHVGKAIYHLDLSLISPVGAESLAPAWSFTFPKLIANHYAMFSGLLLGLAASAVAPTFATRISHKFDTIVSMMLRGIIAIIPLFIAGFAVKIVHDKMLEKIISDYSIIFGIVAFAQFSYLTFVCLAVNGFKIRPFVACVKNLLPAAVTGFSSMSSAATMPLTLLAAERNTGNPDFARLVVPTTTNIHLVGCSFAIPILAYAVMKNFGMPEPDMISCAWFVGLFLITKFSAAGIPAGGIIVMLPILESQFGFQGEMSSLIYALYVLLDPIITTTNVLGNSMIVLVLQKVLRAKRPELVQAT